MPAHLQSLGIHYFSRWSLPGQKVILGAELRTSLSLATTTSPRQIPAFHRFALLPAPQIPPPPTGSPGPQLCHHHLPQQQGTHLCPLSFSRWVSMSVHIHSLVHKLPGFWPHRQRAHWPFRSPIPYMTQLAGSKPNLKSLPMCCCCGSAPTLTPNSVISPVVEARSGPTYVRAQFYQVRTGPRAQPAEVCVIPTSSSPTLAIPPSFLSSPNLIHMLSVALAKPLIKMTRKGRLKEERWITPPGTLSDCLPLGEDTA